MRYGIVFLVAALTGCATVKSAAREDGMSVSYVGTAGGAQKVLSATDERPYDLASKAMDKGMPTNFVRDVNGNVRFSAGYGYVSGTGSSVGEYAHSNVGFVPGRGFIVGSPMSTLPPLNTNVRTTGTPGWHPTPCPTNRVPASDAEVAACAHKTAKTALEQSNK